MTMNQDQPPWDFNLLGGLQVKHQAQAKPLPPYRCQPLLAWLLLNPRKSSRLAIVGQLFPDQPEAKGRRYLSERLWSLRRTLPELPLQADQGSIYLPVESRQLDIERFQRLLAANDFASQRKAAAVYRGDLLPAHFDEWVLLERESMRIQYVELLHNLADQYRSDDRIQQALSTLQELHRMEPMDELVIQSLMELNAQLGRRSVSLELFDDYQSMLAELGLEPSEQLLATSKQLVQATTPAAKPVEIDALPNQDLSWQVDQLLQRAAWTEAESLIESLADVDQVEIAGWRFDLALAREDTAAAKKWVQQLDDDKATSVIRTAQFAVHCAQHAEAIDELNELLLSEGENLSLENAWQLQRTLAGAHLANGDLAEAQNSAVAANRLADRMSHHYQQASSWLLLGQIRSLRGDHDDAAGHFNAVVETADQEGFRLLAAKAFYWLSVIASQRGHLQENLLQIRHCLQIVRDLGLPRFEVKVLNKLAFANDQLGRHHQSMQALTQARLLLDSMDHPAGRAETLYNTAAAISWHQEGSIEFGIALARQVMDYYQSRQAKGWVASCHALIGILEWRAGRPQESFENYMEAYQRHGALGESFYQNNLLGEIAIVLVELGRVDEAVSYARKGLLFVQQDGQGDDFEVLNYYAAGLAFQAAGQTARADDYFKQAFGAVLRLASDITIPELRVAFMRREEVYRRLLNVVRERELVELPPEIAAASAKEGIVELKADPSQPDPGQNLRRADGSIKRRRQRLLELRSMTDQEGHALTVQEMADRLGVSKRTVQRDLAFLRKDS